MIHIFRIRVVYQAIICIAVITFINLIQSCYYYKVTRSEAPPKQTLSNLQGAGKYIILHHKNNVWHFTDIRTNEISVSGSISNLIGHDEYKTTKTRPGAANRYRRDLDIINEKPEVLNEVHIYISGYSQMGGYNISFADSSINKIEIYEPDKGATVASWVFSGLGIAGAAVAAVTIIALLTKSSCPFIYINNGLSYEFNGEIYSGAIYPSLERHDYLPLHQINAGPTDYTIKITNEVHEIQNTNFIELIAFDHSAGSKVLIDKNGAYQTATALKSPETAVNYQGKNILDRILKEDSLSYFGDTQSKEMDGIILKFKKPDSAKICKLFIRAKNSFWLDYVYSCFNNLFGSSYKRFREDQKTVPASKHLEWNLIQGIPLSVYIEKNGKWEFADYFNIAGPMSFKEDVLSINISNLVSDTFSIRLESGSFFWDIDYVGIDYTSNLELKSYEIPLHHAFNNKAEDITDLLKWDDNKYYVQKEVGDEAILTFTAPEPSKTKRSIFLHSKGYYEITQNPSGIADKKYLEAFREPGRFPKYSLELLRASMREKK